MEDSSPLWDCSPMRAEDKITGPKLESSWLAYIPWMQAKFINNFLSQKQHKTISIWQKGYKETR